MSSLDCPGMTKYVSQNYATIPESGCWIWLGAWTNDNYGRINRRNGGSNIVSRLFYSAHKGEIPKGLYVCHKCDTPPCCNPDHLFLGTLAENSLDMKMKGRARVAIGSKNSLAKLDDEKVAMILKDNRIARLVAKDFGVSRSTIASIRTGLIWTHVSKRIRNV